MTLSKLRFGELLAGAGAAALLVILFVPWFRQLGHDRSALDSLTVILAFLAVSAALGLALLITTAFQRSQAFPVAAEVWAAAVATPTVVLVAIRIAFAPSGNAVRWGAWAGLGATVAVALGAWLALRTEDR